MDEALKDDFKKFKESQKGKHCSIWGLKDVEDAFQAGYELRNKHTNHYEDMLDMVSTQDSEEK